MFCQENESKAAGKLHVLRMINCTHDQSYDRCAMSMERIDLTQIQASNWSSVGDVNRVQLDRQLYVAETRNKPVTDHQ